MTDRIPAYINDTTLAPSDIVLSLTTPRRVVTWQDSAGPVNITGGTPVAYAARGERQVELQATILDATAGEVLVAWDAGTLTAGQWTIEHRLTLGGVTSGVRWLVDVVASFFVPPTGEPVVTAPGTITQTGTGPVTLTFTAPSYTGTEPITVTLAATLGGADLTVTGNTATVARTTALQDVSAVWTLDGPVGDPVVLPAVTAQVAAATAPTAPLAPTLTPTGATTMTATLAEDQADGGAELSDRTLVITVNGSAITPVTGLAAEAAHTITGLTAGDTVVGRVDVTTLAGTTQGATATAQTWQLPATMAAPTLAGDVGEATITWPAAPNLNGRPLAANGYRYEVTTAADTGFAAVVASGQQADLTATTITPLGAGDYIARVRAVTDAGPGEWSLASAAATVATGAAATIATTFDDRSIFDTQRGTAGATLSLAGTTDADDGEAMQVRWVPFDDVTDAAGTPGAWQSAGTAASGAWSGTLTAPVGVGVYYRAEAAVVGSGATPARMTQRFAAGHVWAFWEQSNGSRLFNSVSSQELYPALNTENDVFVLARQTQTTGDGTDPAHYELRAVNTANAVADTPAISPAAVAMANAFAAARPGEKLLLIAHTQQETHPVDGLTTTAEQASGSYADRLTARDFTVDYAIHQRATAHGTQVGAVFVPGWTEAIGNLPSVLNTHSRLFVGREFATGAKTSIVNGDSTMGVPRLYLNTYADGMTEDGSGTDLTTAVDVGGNAELSVGGLYDMTYTRWAFFGPHGDAKRPALSQVPAASAVSSLSELRYDTSADLQFDTLVRQARETWATPGASWPEVLPYVGVTPSAWREASDGVHMRNDVTGRDRLAKQWMWSALKSTGLVDDPIPVLDMRFTAADGSYADFGIIGRNVTTTRLLRSLDPIAQIGATGGNQDTATGANTPHRTEVMGWGINNVAAGRTEIHTVTAGDVSAGHPGTAGQTVCRVYAPTGNTFGWEDSIIYGPGRLPDILVAEDYDDGAHLNLLVADMGQPQGIIDALPVQVGAYGMPDTDLVAPDVFSTGGTAKIRTDDNAIMAGFNQAHYETQFRLMSIAFAQQTAIVQFGAEAYARIETDGGVVLSDGTNSATLPAGTVEVGLFVTLAMTVDRSAGTMEIAVNGGTPVSTTTGTGNFSGRLQFFGVATAPPAAQDSTVVYALAYLGSTDNSGSPTHGFEGNAAAAETVGLAAAGSATVYGAAELETFGGGTGVFTGSI